MPAGINVDAFLTGFGLAFGVWAVVWAVLIAIDVVRKMLGGVE